MKRYKYLLKNIGILTIGNLGSNIILFLMVPLYTTSLTTAEYGIYDIFYSMNCILIPVLTMNISEAVVRFSIDADFKKNSIFSTGIRWLMIGSSLVAIMLVVNHILRIWPLLDEYVVEYFCFFFFQALSGIVISFARGTEDMKGVAASTLIGSVTLIGCNLTFLLLLGFGIRGYLWANILGSVAQILFLFIRLRLFKFIDLRLVDRYTSGQMLLFSRPMIVNSISWWITSLSDRYFVTWICGLGENGIYSVAGKIPSILNLFQLIFNEAWIISAVRDFDKDDKDGFFSRTYNNYCGLMALLCSVIIVFCRPMAVFLYIGEFYSAWRYVSILALAAVFNAIGGYIGGLFAAMKNTKVYATSTMVGAIVNIVLNACLIPFMGALGAAVATLISFIVIWLYRLITLKKVMVFHIRFIRDICSFVLLLGQGVLLLLFSAETLSLYAAECGLFLIQILLWREVLGGIIKKVLNRGKNDEK